MRIVIAPDSFKDSLPARSVCEAIRKGIESLPGKWEIVMVPMADGGEGTVESLVDATGGRYFTASVKDPLFRDIRAQFGMLGDRVTAVIEMAAASGIELLNREERNPWVTTTYGTGQLLAEAIRRGSSRIIIGIGGSATNDGGAGMAQALGIRFFDGQGRETGRCGGELGEIVRIDLERLNPEIARTEIIVACDVRNKLTGPLGASAVYGPQKGASPEMVEKLDRNLGHFADMIRKYTGREVRDIEGAGAAGGLGAGLLAFTGARLEPGFEIVARETQLESKLNNADLVITGEGKIDNQTRFGKTPMGVAKLAGKQGIPVIALSGTLGEGYQELYGQGFDALFSIIDKPMSLDEARANAYELLERKAHAVLRTWMAARKK